MRPTPSAEIYFTHALSDLIGTSNQHPVRRLGNNLFAGGGRYVLVRYATRDELALIAAVRPGELFYVIDDDLGAIAEDRTLPKDYRRRLAQFVQRVLPDILALSPRIVAPNPLLFRALGRSDGLLLEPAHVSLCTDFSHFDRREPLRLVFSGTRSHSADLAEVTPGILRFMEGHPEARLVTFLGSHAPPPLRRHPQVENRLGLDWPRYRDVLIHERFHIALAPFRQTPANEARSANKINDHAAFGATSVYGQTAPYRDRISHGRNGLLVGSEPQSWHATLDQLASSSHRMRAIAEAGAVLAARLGDPGRQRRFWLEQLGL